MEVGARIGRLASEVDQLACEGIVVSHIVNVRYLTGFTGSSGMVVVAEGAATLVTDGRYGEQAAEQIERAGAIVDVQVVDSAGGAVLGRLLGGAKRVALEAEHVTWARQREIAERWLPAAELVPSEGAVEALRATKDEGELARLEHAADIADRALAEVLPMLGSGPSERDVAFELDAAVRRLGGDGPSFETIVASGPNSARPHARPSSRRIDAGDLVVIDFGALFEGYHSDMTRSFVIGEPDAVQQRLLEVVTAAQAAGVAAVGSGVPAREVDRACREVIEAAGWGDEFLHATGHGVGLDIHEHPRVAATSDATLADRQVVTVEPGVYLAEVGGVRVEDTLVVTASGSRAITLAPKSEAA